MKKDSTNVITEGLAKRILAVYPGLEIFNVLERIYVQLIYSIARNTRKTSETDLLMKYNTTHSL